MAYLLKGSARREAGRVRISAELIQAQNQTQIWADTFERELSGIFALQCEVAKQVANALALPLLPAEQARLANVQIVNPEAYGAYLQGVRAHRFITKPSLEAAAQYFNEALKVARTAVLGSLFMKGEFEEAYRGELEHFGGDPELKNALERGHAEGGYRNAAKRLADVLAGRFGKAGGTGAYHMANLYVHAGDRERTLEWLHRAYEVRDPNMPYLAQPRWDSVRADPRFQDLVRRMGLPQ